MAIAENILAHRYWEKFGNRWNNVNGIERWQICLKKGVLFKNQISWLEISVEIGGQLGYLRPSLLQLGYDCDYEHALMIIDDDRTDETYQRIL